VWSYSGRRKYGARLQQAKDAKTAQNVIDHAGDIWTWVAIDPQNKTHSLFYVGGRKRIVQTNSSMILLHVCLTESNYQAMDWK